MIYIKCSDDMLNKKRLRYICEISLLFLSMYFISGDFPSGFGPYGYKVSKYDNRWDFNTELMNFFRVRNSRQFKNEILALFLIKRIEKKWLLCHQMRDLFDSR